MMGLQIANPLWLVGLLPVVAVVVWSIRRGRAAVLYSSETLVSSLPVTFAQRIKALLPWLRAIGLALIVFALARPQRGYEHFRVKTDGIAIQMCIDRSGSMEAMDFNLDGEQVTRLAAVKKVFNDFVLGDDELPGRPDDQIGLIAFGGFADSMCPLTLDHGALTSVLESVEVPQPVLNSKGQIINRALYQEETRTAIGDAIALAVERLKGVEAKSKVLILLSDGTSNAGVVQPLEAAQAAKTFGIRIYTIGIGTNGVAPFKATDRFGRTVMRRQRVEMDENALREIADTADGQYFHATNLEALREVYGQIDQLEKTESESHLYTEYHELYQYAMFPGIVLLLLELMLVATRFRPLP